MDSPGLLSPLTRIKGVFIMVCLLGLTRCSETDSRCLCTDIKPWPLTQPTTLDCFEMNATYRYKCIDGYVRRAGTSNLIRCIAKEKWTEPSLECIVNPLNPLPTTTTTTTTTAMRTTFYTSTVTPSLSSVKSATEYQELTSTLLPPHHSPGAPLETSALPQENSTFSTSPRTPSSDLFSSPVSTVVPSQHFPDSPSTTPVSASTPERSYATSAVSSPTTTKRVRLLKTTTSSSPSSSQQGAHAVAAEVIAPVAVGILVLAAAGAIWLLYRRKARAKSETQTSAEERVPMNNMT